jgi:hypothetical protein
LRASPVVLATQQGDAEIGDGGPPQILFGFDENLAAMAGRWGTLIRRRPPSMRAIQVRTALRIQPERAWCRERDLLA